MRHRPIRVGLVGASVDPAKSWGTRAHIPALRHLPDYELTALCTSRPETAAAAAQYFGAPHAFSDPRRMAECKDVDLVVIAVRAPLHRLMVEAAIAAGKPVYCEWPLGVTTAEARELLEATNRAGVLNMIGLQGRHNEGIVYARDLIAEGYVGRVTSVAVKLTQANFGPIETRENAYTADIRNGATLLRIATAQALEAVREAVGELRTLSAVISNQHPIARLADTGESIPKTAPDQVLISGVLEGGAVASIHIRGGANAATSEARLEINGTEGDLLLVSSGAANIHRAPLSVSGARKDAATLAPLTVPERYALIPPGLPDGPARYLAHSYVALAKAFREGSRSAQPDFAYAVRWHEFIDAIESASETGCRVTFPAQSPSV